MVRYMVSPYATNASHRHQWHRRRYAGEEHHHNIEYMPSFSSHNIIREMASTLLTRSRFHRRIRHTITRPNEYIITAHTLLTGDTLVTTTFIKDKTPEAGHRSRRYAAVDVIVVVGATRSVSVCRLAQQRDGNIMRSPSFIIVNTRAR